MAYTDLVTALKTLAIPVAENAFKSRPEVNTYAIVQLDFEADAFDGDDKKLDRSFSGSVDLFSFSKNGDGYALNGSNRSPQLSWEPVDGAGCYAIFMVDTTAGNWLHWKSVSESETELPAGWAPEKEYKGPYPPSGTHSYEVYVFALKQAPERIKGAFDASNEKMYDFMKELDGDGGNIISYGHIDGTYTHGD